MVENYTMKKHRSWTLANQGLLVWFLGESITWQEYSFTPSTSKVSQLLNLKCKSGLEGWLGS